MTRIFRYVPHSDVERRLRQGWFISADLGPSHGCYSVLMERVCECGRMPY
jgi:hypothetical protein